MATLLGWNNFRKDEVIPTIIKPIYQGNEKEKSVALTCNVFWGEEYIGRMLEILDQKNVNMTFFIGGCWAGKFPQMVEEIYQKGHEIGSHGYSHPHPDHISREANIQDMIEAEKIITKITGKKPVLYAPPYGERGNSVLQASAQMGYHTILWSIDTIDWQHPSPEIIRDRVLTKVHNGGIVLMHPTASTVNALPSIIDGITKQGYQIITVGEMLKQLPEKKYQ